MTKTELYYQKMIDQNMDLFGEFQDIHDKYLSNPLMWQVKYNEIGDKVVTVIREWEKRLCQGSEGGMYSKFSAKLADKFWAFVRRDFSKIDFVGIK